MLEPLVSVPMAHGNAVHAPLTDTSDKRAGVGSVTFTLCASDGPLFVTVIVNVTFEPGFADAGPLFVTLTSAFWTNVTVAAALLLPADGSVVVDVTVAVFATGPLAFDGAL